MSSPLPPPRVEQGEQEPLLGRPGANTQPVDGQLRYNLFSGTAPIAQAGALALALVVWGSIFMHPLMLFSAHPVCTVCPQYANLSTDELCLRSCSTRRASPFCFNRRSSCNRLTRLTRSTTSVLYQRMRPKILTLSSGRYCTLHLERHCYQPDVFCLCRDIGQQNSLRP
jgi:hypothetical protein